MKRIVAVLLFLCMVPLCASASGYLEDLDIYAELFGVPEISSAPKETVHGKTIYTVGGGFVGLEESSGELESVSVFGTGDNLLIYAVSAICVMEGTNDNFTQNCGILLSSYLICRMNGEEQFANTKGGLFYLIQPYNDGYMVIIQR